MRVLILVSMCPHTAICVLIQRKGLGVDAHTAIYVSCHCCICVLIVVSTYVHTQGKRGVDASGAGVCSRMAYAPVYAQGVIDLAYKASCTEDICSLRPHTLRRYAPVYPQGCCILKELLYAESIRQLLELAHIGKECILRMCALTQVYMYVL